MKSFFKNLWTKVKPYIGYIGAFLAGLIGFLVLGKKKTPTASDELTRQQDIRDEKAEEITKETEQILGSADQRIEDYYKNKQNRGL